VNRIALGLFSLLLPMLGVAKEAADWDAQGDLAKTKKDLKDAQADYTKALAENPKDVHARIMRGSVRDLLGDFDGAIADDTAAIALEPKNAVAYTNRGNVRASQRNPLGAISDYTQALALDPHHVPALLNRGNIEYLRRNYHAALADYNSVIALDPKNALAFYNRAGVKRASVDLAGSVADYSQAITLNPADVRAWLNRAVLKMAQRDWDGATADLQHCLELIPHDQQIYPRIYLWVIGSQQGKQPAATQDLLDYLGPSSGTFAKSWGWQVENFCVGKIDEKTFIADAVSLHMKTNHGQLGQAYYYAGLKHLFAGERQAAIRFFRLSLATGDLHVHEVILAREELKWLRDNPS